MIIVSMRYHGTWLVNGNSPVGCPAPLLLKTRDRDGLRILGHAALDPDTELWEVKVDAWRYGTFPTGPSRHLCTLGHYANRTDAALRLIGAAPALAQEV